MSEWQNPPEEESVKVEESSPDQILIPFTKDQINSIEMGLGFGSVLGDVLVENGKYPENEMDKIHGIADVFIEARNRSGIGGEGVDEIVENGMMAQAFVEGRVLDPVRMTLALKCATTMLLMLDQDKRERHDKDYPDYKKVHNEFTIDILKLLSTMSGGVPIEERKEHAKYFNHMSDLFGFEIYQRINEEGDPYYVEK